MRPVAKHKLSEVELCKAQVDFCEIILPNSGVKRNREMHEEVVNCLNELQRMRDEFREYEVEHLADWDKIFAQVDSLLSKGSCESHAGDEL